MQRAEKRAYWSEQIDTWKTSGLSRRTFCLRNGIAYKTFLYWDRNLRTEAEEGGPLCVEVAPVAARVEGVIVDIQGMRVPVGEGEVTICGRIGVGRLLRVLEACGVGDVSAEA